MDYKEVDFNGVIFHNYMDRLLINEIKENLEERIICRWSDRKISKHSLSFWNKVDDTMGGEPLYTEEIEGIIIRYD